MTTRASSADLLAGLSVAGLLLPEAVAYSGVANLPPGRACSACSRDCCVTVSSAAVLASATLTLGGISVGAGRSLRAWLRKGAGTRRRASRGAALRAPLDMLLTHYA